MNVMQEESALAKCEKLKASGDINEMNIVRMWISIGQDWKML